MKEALVSEYYAHPYISKDLIVIDMKFNTILRRKQPMMSNEQRYGPLQKVGLGRTLIGHETI